MRRFRASYSTLKLWDNAKYEEACMTYFHIKREFNPYIQQGIDFHKKWQEETEKTKQLPSIFGKSDYSEVKTELKLEYQMKDYDWLEMVGIIDMIGKSEYGHIINEYKTGVTSSQSYANTKQLGMQAILAIVNGYEPKMGIIRHLNQYSGIIDNSYVFITPDLINETMEWIITLSSEMKLYLDKNDLYNRYNDKENEIVPDNEFFNDIIDDLANE